MNPATNPKVLIIHYELDKSFFQKNLGYFIKYCLDHNFRITYLTLKSSISANDLSPNFKVKLLNFGSLDTLEFIHWLRSDQEKYDYAWLYPFYSRLLITLLILRLKGIKPILKMDSSLFATDLDSAYTRIKAKVKATLVSLLAWQMLVESGEVGKQFIIKRNQRRFTIGLPKSSVELINQLPGQRQNIITYSGRIIPVKNLIGVIKVFIKLNQNKIIDNTWKLQVMGKIIDQDYYQTCVNLIKSAGLISRFQYLGELTGMDYYRHLKKSSLIIDPGLNQGLPNIMADALFSRRLYLTTTGSKCAHLIADKQFVADTNQESIFNHTKEIIQNLSKYYDQYDQLYYLDQLIETDQFFNSLFN
jgi:glycosyltransferase involved in cell wall biosynthesis